MRELNRTGEETALNLHHLGDNPLESNFARFDDAAHISVYNATVPKSGHASMINTLEFLNATRPTVFIPQALPAPHFAAKWAESCGLPWVLTMHSDDPAYWSLLEAVTPAKPRGRIVAVSESIATQVTSRYPQTDVTVIPCGVKIPAQAVAWNPDRFRVVFSGRLLETQKCISKVIDTLIIACGLSSCLEAVIIGDGADRAKVESTVAKAQLTGRIRFAGRLSAQDVENELIQAQAIILMSDYEGLPVALLEGMAYGLVPVVRNIRSGIPEIVHHGSTGILVDDKPDNAARALVALANDPQRWQELSDRARALVRTNFSMESCFEKWRKLLTALASQATAAFPITLPTPAAHPEFFTKLRQFDPPRRSGIAVMTGRLRNLAKAVRRRVFGSGR